MTYLIGLLASYEKYILSYVLAINLTAFLVYGIDKLKAKKGAFRTPELHLILLSLLGGGVGSLMAMVIFKHKLSKKPFYIGVPIIILINLIVLLLSINFFRS